MPVKAPKKAAAALPVTFQKTRDGKNVLTGKGARNRQEPTANLWHAIPEDEQRQQPAGNGTCNPNASGCAERVENRHGSGGEDQKRLRKEIGAEDVPPLQPA